MLAAIRIGCSGKSEFFGGMVGMWYRQRRRSHLKGGDMETRSFWFAVKEVSIIDISVGDTRSL